MANNLAVQVTADVADLTGKMGLAKASLAELSKEHRQLAAQINAGDGSEVAATRYLELSDAISKTSATAAIYKREIADSNSAYSKAAANAARLAQEAATLRAELDPMYAAQQRFDNEMERADRLYEAGTISLREYEAAQNQARTSLQSHAVAVAGSNEQLKQGAVTAGAMKTGMQSLSYQINDMATMFAMGARPMQIFASQGGQVIQAVQQMSGEAKGLLGVLGGPWGMAITTATVALTPFIAKMFETKDAADAMGNAASNAMAKLNASMVSAQSVTGEAANDATNRLLKGMGALAKANRELKLAESPDDASSADQAQDRAANMLAIQRRRDAAQAEIKSANEDLDKIRSATRVQALQAAAQTRLNAANATRNTATGSSGSRSTSSNTSGGGSGVAAASAVVDQDALQAAREALQERIDIIRQEEALSEGRASTEIELSRIVLESKIDDVEALARAGQISDAEAIQRRAALIGQLDQLDLQHETRVYQARLKQMQDEMANYAAGTKEYREYLRRIEELDAQHQNRVTILNAQSVQRRKQQDRLADTESNRRMVGMANTWASNLARMATMQQGFSATVKGMWQGIASTAASVIEQIIQQWIIGEMIKLGLAKKSGDTTIASEAAKAGAAGTASMAGAPFPMNLTAPMFGAAMSAVAQSYSIAQHASGTSQLPNDRIALVHAGERIVPKADNDVLLELTKRGAMMGSGMTGAAGGGMQTVRGGDSFTINAVDARSVTRLLTDNNRGVAKALQRAVRSNVRPK